MPPTPQTPLDTTGSPARRAPRACSRRCAPSSPRDTRARRSVRRPRTSSILARAPGSSCCSSRPSRARPWASTGRTTSSMSPAKTWSTRARRTAASRRLTHGRSRCPTLAETSRSRAGRSATSRRSTNSRTRLGGAETLGAHGGTSSTARSTRSIASSARAAWQSSSSRLGRRQKPLGGWAASTTRTCACEGSRRRGCGPTTSLPVRPRPRPFASSSTAAPSARGSASAQDASRALCPSVQGSGGVGDHYST
mmetsp:Transcript_41838/g.103193  ORF Transcript_41838/g.103193 Transcript_41838/m.103193 type:complete len:252 (+) Transcript_41838:245-1000(+)